MKKYFKRALWDRYDGWRVRKVDGVFNIIPFIMKSRVESQNYFEENILIDKIEAFVRTHNEEIPNLSTMHIIMAAVVRAFSQRPYMNRFVVYNKIYARNHLNMSLVIKRADMKSETIIKPEFEPEDTLYDVVRRVNELVASGRSGEDDSDTDKIIEILSKLPTTVMRFAVGILKKLDNIGKLPKIINEVSPWHCSIFMTNVGSLGISPIYHHLTEFGTNSMFIAMGKKEKRLVLDKDGTVREERSIGLKFTLDDRVCDGQYYANSIKLMRKYMQNPELLLVPPREVVVDDGVGRQRLV
ncbi:MAG: 2-oxo acid dehydrogenase subunit E2 [Clostridia bacterium]|nr:2-oxo acid dehydrogenase subunit E2 [Clostridia bacterium]